VPGRRRGGPNFSVILNHKRRDRLYGKKEKNPPPPPPPPLPTPPPLKWRGEGLATFEIVRGTTVEKGGPTANKKLEEKKPAHAPKGPAGGGRKTT